MRKSCPRAGFPHQCQLLFCSSEGVSTACHPSLPVHCNGPFLLSLNQQVMYFFIADLGEIFIPEAYTVEWFRGVCTNDLVYLSLKLVTGWGSCYRHRYHDTGRMLLSQCRYCRAHRGTR